MTLVLHPQCIGRISRINMLEELIEHMKSKEGTVIGPALEIARLAKEGLGDNINFE